MADEIQIGKTLVRLMQGNIVEAGTEAIVNAANSSLAGGGGVDGAIHRAAGTELYEMTRKFGGCPTGSAVITGAGQIPSPTRFVIHAVGPIYNAYDADDRRSLLAGAYQRSLELAAENQIRSIAFPSISTGAYGYPIEEAAGVALGATKDFLASKPHDLRLVLFVLFSTPDYRVYQRLLPSFA